MNAIYTELGQEYDVLVEKFGDNVPSTLLGLIESHFPEKETRTALSVYELGVGTGRFGKSLISAGFTEIEGIEPCEAFLKLAEKSGVYKDLKLRYSGELEKEWTCKFDIAVGCGVFMKNHVPPSGLDELVAAVKQGGVVAFPVREDEWVELGFKEKAEALEQEGKWKLLQREEKANPDKGDVQWIYIHSLYLKL